MNDNINIRLAFSVHASPGQYALLLGSGISKDTGIPTGGKIANLLIQQIAERKGAIPDNLWEWFEREFGKEPSYSNILDQITTCESDRRGLLSHFFEPSEEDLEVGNKQPTQAHHSIARLVKAGYIRVIITTNFDRLLERGLNDIGVTPVVVTEESVQGAEPYSRNSCTIVKVNGDYLGSRLKNTHSELSTYTDAMNVYLDRIFDEHGLIFCGWSAENDIALVDAIKRCRNRRYGSFWGLYHEDLTKSEQDLVTHLKAYTLQNVDANSVFTTLEVDVDALMKMGSRDPLTVTIAIERTKKYLSEERYRIRLHDLVYEEIEYLYNRILEEEQAPFKGMAADEFLLYRMKKYEELTAPLLHMLVTVAIHTNGDYFEYFTEAIERLGNIPEQDYQNITALKKAYPINETIAKLQELRLYPSLLLMYATGIISIKKRHYQNLDGILSRPRFYHRLLVNVKKIPIFDRINFWRSFRQNIGEEPVFLTPPYQELMNNLYNFVKGTFPNRHEFDEIFNKYEYFLGLMYIHYHHDELCQPKGAHTQLHPSLHSWLWVRTGDLTSEEKIRVPSYIQEFSQDVIANDIVGSPLFDGKAERYKNCEMIWQQYFGVYKSPPGMIL
jgi:hypothetical protein